MHHVKITESMLSRYIHGISVMPGQIEHILTTQYRFNSNFFAKHHANVQDKLSLDLLTKEDLYKLIHEQQLLINEWKESYYNNANRIHAMLDDIRDLSKQSSALIDKVDKLQEQNRELRKQLKKEE